MKRIIIASMAALLLAACGSQRGGWGEIPRAEGNDRAPVALSAGPDELAVRAAAEREDGQWARADRFVRWALALAPEHPGALVEGARLARDRGDHESARRYYAMASSLAGAGTVLDERSAQLIAYARSELEAGRVEQTAALLEEVDGLAGSGARGGHERRELAELHGALADEWLGRGLGAAGRAHAERAARLGADGDRTRTRLLEADILVADRPGPTQPSGRAGSGLGALEAKVMDALGRDGAAWRALASWFLRLGWDDSGRWAAERAVTLSADEPAALLVLADALLVSEREGEALEACVKAARHMKAAEGAAALAAFAERLDRAGAKPEAMAAAEAAVERAAGAEGGVRGAVLGAEWALVAKDPERGVALLVVAAAAAPEAWRLLVAPVFAADDPARVAAVLAAAREAGLKSWVAHALEAGQWRAAQARMPDPQRRQGAVVSAEAAFEAALEAGPGFVGLLELARIARIDEGLRARIVRVEGPGAGAVRAYLEAIAARGDVTRARAALEAGLAGANAFEAAFVRAHFELEGGEPARALALAEAAVRVAGPEEAPAAEAFAMGQALRSTPGRIEARAHAWLSLSRDAQVMELPYRSQWLLRLREKTRSSLELQARVLVEVLEDPTCRRAIDPQTVELELLQVLAKLGRTDELEEVWARRLARGPDPRATTEELAMKLAGEGRVAMALRFYARLHPEEIAHREVLTDLAKHLEAAAEPLRARRVASRVLALPGGAGVGTSRLLGMAQDLLDAGHRDLAARAFERAIDEGDRSSRAWLGWMRALLRSGDTAASDGVVARYLESRQRRDTKATEELAKALMEEGRIARAVEVIEARLGSDPPDAGTFNLLTEALWRSGRGDGLAALARRFIGADPRSAQRQIGTAATRLVELRALGDARTIVAQGLEARPRDPTLLSLATMIALGSGGEDVEALAGRTLRDLGGTFDAWDRVVGDVRANQRPDIAERLVTTGLERFSGAHRLLVLRGRVRLSAGLADAAFEDFAEALARAPSPRDVLDPLEPVLERASQFERLSRLEARALSLTSGRADHSLQLGRALLAAGRVDEAAQVFERVAAESDRAQGALATAWFKGGYLGNALDAWGRALEATTTEELVATLEQVAGALASRGEAGRLELFVQLYLQALRGTDSAPLLPIAAAWKRVGRPDRATVWLERADRETPSPDSALMLMRHRLDLGDRRGALAAAERVVTRRVALAQPGRTGSAVVGPALEPVASELILRGDPELARDLAGRTAAVHGESSAVRLVRARALLASGDAAAALGELAYDLEPIKQARDLTGLVRAVLDELVIRGHLEAALGFALKALEGGAERELLLGAARIAARAGHAPVAVALMRRLAVTQAAPNAWLAGDVLASERLPRSSAAPLAAALMPGPSGSALQRAALAAALANGERIADLPGLGARIPRLGEDRIERALIEGYVASALPEAGGPAHAVDALMPALRAGVIDPAIVNLAVAMASLAGGEATAQVLAALRFGTVDRTRLGLQVGRYLAEIGRLDAALQVFDALLESDGGDGELALEVFGYALGAGDEARALRWAEKALGAGPEGNTATLRSLFADKAAALGARGVASSLLEGEGADSWRGSWTRARLALGGGDREGFRAAFTRALSLAPDAAVMRVEAATWMVTSGGDAGARDAWAGEVQQVLEPLLAGENAPAAALELAFCASVDAAAARGVLARLQAHYPGALRFPRAMLRAALMLGDPESAARVLAAIPPEPRRDELVSALDAELRGGVNLATSLYRLVEAEIERAAPNAVSRVALEILLGRHRGDALGAVRAAESAVQRAPWSSELALLLAHTLAVTRRDPARAERIVREVMGRPAELGLFDAELRFLMPSSAWRGWEVLALLRSQAGDREGARRYLDRALMLAPAGERPRISGLRSP